MSTRHNTYSTLSTHLAQLSDQALHDLASHDHHSIGGKTSTIKLDNKTIFIKKIRLTDLEKSHAQSTANLFKLPLFYQYGIGSTGFGAWRELACHLMTTQWVISGECINFPLLYHWRIMPAATTTPTAEQLKELNADVRYWGGSPAIRNRLEQKLNATDEIILCLEYFPQNLHGWLNAQIHKSEKVAEKSCLMVEAQLTKIIEFLKTKDFLHFDAHFMNILTDGHELYLTDFGLAISSQFELSPAEKNFVQTHVNYDHYSTLTNLLNCIIVTYFDTGNFGLKLNNFMNGNLGTLPPAIMSLLQRNSSVALLMDTFYKELQSSKTTSYPAHELKKAFASRTKLS